MSGEADGFDLIYYVLWIGAVLAEFFVPFTVFGGHTLCEWLTVWVDKWSIGYQEAHNAWMSFPALATGLVLLLATWIVISRVVRRLRRAGRAKP